MAAAPAENRVVLRNISWETFERLSAECVNVAGTHFTYDEGNLEIVSVSLGHELPHHALVTLVDLTAEETERDFVGAGSSTFTRTDLAKSFEADSSFYFRHAAEVRAKDKIDLPIDPSPELIIEVDITRSSLNHFPLYAAIGIAEIWRFDGERVRFHRLEGSGYIPIEESVVLSPMTAAQATVFVERARHEKAPDWWRAVREWVRARCSA
ncbi:conserved hypothetical protein [Candidatus Sulfopaludibacter sp. SbA4]|nr:conserved hypothetical protein [Candidatus Sulfopaludibacter sp. SbA4]